MRTIIAVEQGVVELNWLWLPTCIGMNATLKKEMEAELAEGIQGRELTDRNLDDIHELVVSYLCTKLPHVDGLEQHLNSLKFLSFK